MEGRTIIVGDHTGVIKVLNPQITSIGKPGPGLSVLSIIPKEDKYLAIRQNGNVDQFDLDGNFESIKTGSKKILDGREIDNKIIVAYADGSFECDKTLKSGIPLCRGISACDNFFAFCGNSNSEIWDVNSEKLAWKARTIKPKEEVFDAKCVLFNSFLYVGTINNEIKVYDTRTMKKPSMVLRLNPKGHIYDYPISALFVNNENVFAGDSIGHVYKLNSAFNLLGKTKGRSVGAIQSIFVKENELYSCGLDRRLMVHDANTLKLLNKQYLWQKLNTVVVF